MSVYHSPKVVRPWSKYCTCWEMITWYANSLISYLIHCISIHWLCILARSLKFVIASVQQWSCIVCSNYTAYMCWTQHLHLHIHCHILWVSHTSDMNTTCYMHSITLKKAIVYVHSGPERHLLPHSIIPTIALLSHFWSHSHTHSHSWWNVCIIPFS